MSIELDWLRDRVAYLERVLRANRIPYDENFPAQIAGMANDPAARVPQGIENSDEAKAWNARQQAKR